MRTLLLIVTLTAGPGGLCRAQNTVGADPPRENPLARDANLPPIPSLESILDAVLAQSPMVLHEAANVIRKENELTRVRRSWMDQLSVSANAQYGVYGNQVLEQASIGRTVGVGLSVSLFDLLGRGAERGVFRQEVAMARQRVAIVKQEVHIEVVRAYRRLEATRQLVRIQSNAWQATKSHLQIAELAFAEGDLTISELARVTEIAAQAESGFESARSEYLTAYGELEVLVGAPLKTLL